MNINSPFRVKHAPAVFGLLVASWLGIISASSAAQTTIETPPTPLVTWIDTKTGHRITRLSSEPNSKTLYFNENAYTPDGKQMIYVASQSVYVLDLTTFKTRQLVAGPAIDVVVGHKSPTVYFMHPNDTSLYAIGVNTGQILKIATLPPNAEISTLNADENLAAGVYVEGNGLDKLNHPPDPNLKAHAVRANVMDERLAMHLPMVLFTLNLQTGAISTVLKGTDWLSHVQFSPKDPTLLMYCHEGLWWKVDRIWTIRADGSQNRLIHTRTVNDEIAGHEFWDPDGKTIWYDLQVPRGQNFYLASYNTDTQAREWYSVERDAWSIHYNVASDDSIFCGDGADGAQVARSRNARWIELFTPNQNPVAPEINQTGLIQSGFFTTEHLASMVKQNYTLEPNVRFSPDHKLVIFTSNMFGPSYVFAVEVAQTVPVTTVITTTTTTTPPTTTPPQK
jgi:oligogalacturonide lyase